MTSSKSQTRALIVGLLVTVNVVLWGILVLPSIRSIAAADGAQQSTNPAHSDAAESTSSSDATRTSDTGKNEKSQSGELTAVDLCRRDMRAAARVISAAKIGVGHWSEHVQAQTDANAGRISDAQMAAIFARTRLAGPADLERYETASTAYGSVGDSCRDVQAADGEDLSALRDCVARRKAQHDVMVAGDAAMGDWESHQMAMRRSREGHVHDALNVWLRAWRAAPPHINAFERAVSRLEEAPHC